MRSSEGRRRDFDESTEMKNNNVDENSMQREEEEKASKF